MCCSGRGRSPGKLAAGFVLLPLVFMVTLVLLGLIITLAPQLHNVQRNPMADLMQNPRDAVIFAFVVMIAGGVREEIQRGFILHRFSQYLGGGAVGVIVHSSLFGLGHVDQGWDAALTVGVLGAIVGHHLSRSPQHRRAHGQPCRLQPDPVAQVPDPAIAT